MAAYLQHPDRVKLTAVCHIIENAAQQYSKLAKVDAVYTDYATMLKDADIISTRKTDKEGSFTPNFKPVETKSLNLPSGNCFVNEILHFEECCRTGKEPISSGKDNIETIKILMGIYESSRTGKPVDVGGRTVVQAEQGSCLAGVDVA